MPQYRITYPGFDQPTGNVTVTMSRGVDPGIISYDVAPDYTPNPQIGNVTFYRDGVPLFTLVDCAGDGVTYSSTEAGQSYTATILDRRWQWVKAKGYVSGHYNRRLADGSIVASSQKSPKQLVDLLLESLGEIGYDTSAVTSSLNDPPEVKWDHVHTVEALRNLLQVLGLELVLRLTPGNPVRIVVPGVGNNLPTTNRKALRQTAAGIAKPAALDLICGETLIEGYLKLEPVARDDDEVWQAVNDLPYMPSGGWEAQDPDYFGGIGGASDEQIANRIARAQADIFRAYRVASLGDGTMVVPQLNVTIDNVNQIVLQDRLLDKIDRPDSKLQYKGAEVYGLWWREGFKPENEPFGTKYIGSIQIVSGEPIIILDRAVRRYTDVEAGTFAFPKLWLRCVYSLTDAETFAPVRHIRSKAISSNGSGAFPIRRDDVYRTIKIPYTANAGPQTYSPGTVTDSLSDTNNTCDYYLDAEALLRSPTSGEDNPYAGFVAIECDGRIAQVTWTLRSAVAETRASTSTEHSHVIPKPNARSRIAQTKSQIQKQKADNSGIKAPVESKDFRPTKRSTPVESKSQLVYPQLTNRWLNLKNVSADTDIPPYGPFKLANSATPADATGNRDYSQKVIPLSDTGIAGVQSVGFAGPLGIKFGKTGKGTFDLPAVGRVKTSGSVGKIYAGAADDLLVTSEPTDLLATFQATHKIGTVGSNEDWIINALQPEVSTTTITGAAGTCGCGVQYARGSQSVTINSVAYEHATTYSITPVCKTGVWEFPEATYDSGSDWVTGAETIYTCGSAGTLTAELTLTPCGYRTVCGQDVLQAKIVLATVSDGCSVTDDPAAVWICDNWNPLGGTSTFTLVTPSVESVLTWRPPSVLCVTPQQQLTVDFVECDTWTVRLPGIVRIDGGFTCSPLTGYNATAQAFMNAATAGGVIMDMSTITAPDITANGALLGPYTLCRGMVKQVIGPEPTQPSYNLNVRFYVLVDVYGLDDTMSVIDPISMPPEGPDYIRVDIQALYDTGCYGGESSSQGYQTFISPASETLIDATDISFAGTAYDVDICDLYLGTGALHVAAAAIECESAV